MTIIETLIQLRNDIKDWVTNNIVALNEKVDGIEGFSGDYNDLTNKPEILEDSSDSFNIADSKGNIILKVDKDGLTTTNVNATNISDAIDEIENLNNLVGDTSVSSQIEEAINSKTYFSGDYNDLTNKPEILEDSSDSFNIADPSGNIILEVNEDGLKTTAISANTVSANGEDVITKIKSVNDSLNNHIDDNVKHITTTERANWNAKSEFSGSYNDLTNKPNLETDETDDSLFITDNQDNIILKIDEAGLETTNIKASTADITTINTTTVNAKDVIINEKNIINYVDESVDAELAKLVNSAPDKLDTLDELAAALGDDENFAANVTESISKKADKEYVDEQLEKKLNIDHNYDDRYYTESEIDEQMSPVNAHINNENIHVTSEDKEKWSNINNIVDDQTGELNIADPSGNIIFKVDETGVDTTSVSIQGVNIEEKFVKIVSLTTAEYEALETKDETTLYNLTDADEDDIVNSINGQTGDVVLDIPIYTAGEGINIDSNNVISSTVKVFEFGATSPTNTNLLWIDTDNNLLKYYDGSQWKPVGAVFGE